MKASAGHGFYCFNMFCDTAPFDNNDLRMALKLAIDREELVKKILAGYGSVGNDMPVNGSYPLFDSSIPQRTYDPDKAALPLQEVGPFRLDPAAHRGRRLPRRGRRGLAVPAVGQEGRHHAGDQARAERRLLERRLEQAAVQRLLLGRPADPGPDVFHRLYLDRGLERHPLQGAGKFDKLILGARAELDAAKRKQMYSDAGRMIRDQGGLINPMFNNFIAAYRDDKVAGWVDNPNQDMMNGLAAVKCWQA